MSRFELSMELSADDDGFLRRACPRCHREFKWLPVDGAEPGPEDEYACPYYASRAAAEDWYTEAQIAKVKDLVGREVVDPRLQDFADRVLQMNAPDSLVEFEVEVSPRGPAPVLTEPNDMVRVDPACHPKPIKVADGWTQQVHCIICGGVVREAA